MLKPDIEAVIRDRSFRIGDTVYVENFSHGPKWLAGTVEEIRGPLTYMVKLTDDKIVRRHVDMCQIRTCTELYRMRLL